MKQQSCKRNLKANIKFMADGRGGDGKEGKSGRSVPYNTNDSAWEICLQPQLVADYFTGQGYSTT
jgi:hypothetical protein